MSEATKIISINELSSPRFLICPNSKREFQIFNGMIVGRQHGDIIFSDDRSVSSKHFSLALNGDVCILEDLNSSNGVFVNGKRVENKIKLHFGDKIRFGNQVLVYSEKQIDDVVFVVRPTFMGSCKDTLKNFYKIQKWDWSTTILALILSSYVFFVYITDFGMWNKKDLLFGHIELTIYYTIDVFLFPFMFFLSYQTLINHFKISSSIGMIFFKMFLLCALLPTYLMYNIVFNSITNYDAKIDASKVEYYCGINRDEESCFRYVGRRNGMLKNYFPPEKASTYSQIYENYKQKAQKTKNPN